MQGKVWCKNDFSLLFPDAFVKRIPVGNRKIIPTEFKKWRVHKEFKKNSTASKYRNFNCDKEFKKNSWIILEGDYRAIQKILSKY